MRTAVVAVLLALAGAAGPPEGAAQESARVPSMCMDCHGDVASGKLAALTHADSVSCLTCHHVGFTNDPAVARARRVETCVACHEALPTTHTYVEAETPECTTCHSIHGDPSLAAEALSERCTSCHTSTHVLHAGAGPDGPECVQCHVAHTGRSFHPRNPALVEKCAGCHEDTHGSHAATGARLDCTACHDVDRAPEQQPQGAELTEACSTCHATVHPPHTVAGPNGPTCVACHDFAADSPLSEAGVEISWRCGSCHEEELSRFRMGGHAEGLGPLVNPDLPNCVTCHVSHVVPGGEDADIRLAATARCMVCHSQAALADKYGLLGNVGASYADDFHGATVEFLRARPDAAAEPVLICADCHGAHEVGWNEDAVVAEVCTRCHDRSDARLAGAWLGHDRVGPHNQVLVWLVRMFYYVLIPFMLTGLFLNIVFHLVDQRRKGARILRSEGVQRLAARLRGRKLPEPETVTRFSPVERWEHFGSMTTFILLVLTGLPQTRPDLALARSIISFLGGIGTTRLIHRTVGVIFVALMVTHVARAVHAAIRHRRLPVMVPTRKDFDDVLRTFRHYLFEERRPRVGKFDFSEKFEYWGLFLGGVVMSTTGIMLLFPELVTEVLPGVVVAAVRLMHGLEATFAVMVVILWHSYGVIFRPEVFPLDTSIFTGKMAVRRLRHEHELEYERLFPDRVAAGHGEGEREPRPALAGPAPSPEPGD